tara:strand:- start:4448 stop:4669 length:222 start_codon:yes stop_codon:yes gene_type:complete
MPFIRRQDIDPDIRAVHDKKAKSRLREALLNPGLSSEQRLSIQQELALLGPARIYDAERPARPGAVSFPLSEA